MKTFKQLFAESSLTRVWQHANSDKPVAIITAFRNENTEKENVALNKQLASKIKQAGYGYFFLDGFWVENQGTDKEVHVAEKSIFIVGNENDNGKLKGLIKKLVKEYKQDAAVYKDEGTDEFVLINNDLSITKIGKFTASKVAQAYSKLNNGRTFIFESATPDKNWLGKYSESI